MKINMYKQKRIFNYYEINGQLVQLPKNKKLDKILKLNDIEQVQFKLRKIINKSDNQFIRCLSILGGTVLLALVTSLFDLRIGNLSLGLMCSCATVISLVPTCVIGVKKMLLNDVKNIIDEEVEMEQNRKSNISVVEKDNTIENNNQINYKYNYSKENNNNIKYPTFGDSKKKK